MGFMEMMGEKGGKMPDMMENMGKPSKPGMGKGKPSKGEMVQAMMAEKKGLCLSQDEVHMICGMGTNLQRKMDAALKQCMPMEMMAATMDDMQAMSMSPDTKLLSSGRAFNFEEPSDRGPEEAFKVKEVLKEACKEAFREALRVQELRSFVPFHGRDESFCHGGDGDRALCSQRHWVD